MRALSALLVSAWLLPAPAAAQLAGPDPAFAELTYRMVGPSRGGRVTAVAGHPAQPGTFYMGATGGGVWKTTDYGQSWVNVSDGYFQTGSIGAIAVAPSDAAIVYVGTGSDGIRSNVIIGRGVYRSNDAGDTWTFLGLREMGQIGAVLVHPTNPEVAYVAAMGDPFRTTPERGVYRTRDGGARWERVLFVSDSTGAVDLEFAPDDPNTLYAAMWRAERKPWTIISGAREGGIYRSTNGGTRWERLTGGLPSGLVGKSDLAVSAADPNRLYVLMEAEPGGGLYRSDDRGRSFSLVSTQTGILNRPFYYTNVDADPTNADVVYINNEGFFRSDNGGRSFQRRGTPHGDNHDMWIDPTDPDVYVQSNDGGANVTRDGGETWTTQHNQPTAELYQVDVDDQFPYWIYAGQQDNSTIAVPSLPPVGHPAGATGHWIEVGGCETGPAVPQPGNPDVVFSNCKGRFGRYDKRTGQEQQYYVGAANLYGHNPRDLTYRFQRVSPIEVSPHDANTVYHGSQYLHRTRDGGVTWETISPDLTAFEPDKQVVPGTPITRDITGEEYYSTIYAIEESPVERGVIWVGANDGPVHVTRDGGATWTDVTPTDLRPGGRVQNIEASPHRGGKAYVAIYRYLLGDWQPYLYRTTDYGRSWTRLTTGSNGIPADAPTRAIAEDPDREGLLYAGTEFGMFVSLDDGATWRPFQQNLPVTPVTDIKVHRQDVILSTMGRSFWILDDVTPLHQLTEQVARADAYLFRPRPAYRLRYSSFGRDPADPEYPPPGAVISYSLGSDARGEVRMEILDADGAVVQQFTSGSGGEAGEAEPAMRGPGTRTGGIQRMARTAGIHRIRWDFRYPGPVGPSGQPMMGGGPMAPPGAYQVRLTVGGWSASVPLTVLMDPRVEAVGITQADLEAQFQLGLRVRDLSGDARQAVTRVQAALRSATGDARVELETIQAALVTARDYAYPQPMLVDQIQYLNGMLSRADQRPGADAHERYHQLRTALDGLLERLERVAPAQ